MTTKDEALKLALETFEADASNENFLVLKHCVREALAEQPAQQLEPVALTPKQVHGIWQSVKPDWDVPRGAVSAIAERVTELLYTSPPASKPLDGAAKTFQAMIDALQAGDSYESVLRQFGYMEVEQPAQQQEPVAWWRLAEDDGHQKHPVVSVEKPHPQWTTTRPLVFGDTFPQQASKPEHQEPTNEETLRVLREATQTLRDHITRYTSPPASKPWVGLTLEDINIAFDDTQEGGGFDDFARAIEAKLREKNT